MTKRILVIEDQEDNRRILRDLLSSVGYELIEAENGEDGVAAAAADRPDLILMDIQLPLLDGYEATRRIKAQSALSAIPIIAVTSYALSGDEDKARAARAMSPSPLVRVSCLPRSGNICPNEPSSDAPSSPHSNRRRQRGEPRHSQRTACATRL